MSIGAETYSQDSVKIKQFYEGVLNATFDPLFVLDRDLKVVFTNDRFLNLLGKFGIPKDIVSKKITSNIPFLEKNYEARYKKIFKNKESSKSEIAFEFEGEKVFFEIVRTIFNITESNDSFIATVIKDTTETKKAELIFTQQIEVEKIISDLSTIFANLPLEKTDEGISHALHLTGSFFNAERSAVFQISHEDNMIKMTHEWIKDKLLQKRTKPRTISIKKLSWLMDKLNNLETFIIKSKDQIPLKAKNERYIFKVLSVRSAILIPVKIQDKLSGFIAYGFNKKDNNWEEEQFYIHNVITETISSALERIKAEKENKEAHQRLLSILNSIDGIVYVADLKTYEVLFINKYAEKIWGMIEGEKCWSYIQKDQKEPCSFCTNHRLIDHKEQPIGVYHWEFQNTVNGRWYDCRDIALRWIDGRLVRLEVATDITKRKEIENELLNEQERLENIIESTQAGTWEWNIETGEIFFNKKFLEHFGLNMKDAEIFHISFRDKVVHPDDLSLSNELLDKHFKGELPYYQFEVRVKNNKGEWVWLQERGKVVKWSKKGKPLLMFGTHTDITEKKKIEEQVIKTKSFLDNVLQSIQDGICVIDRNLRIKHVNHTMNEWYPDKVPLEGKKCYHVYHNCSVPCTKCPTIKCFKSGKTEKEIVPGPDKDGKSWLELYSYPLIDAVTGEVEQVVEFVRDITDRKKSEIALQKSNTELIEANQKIRSTQKDLINLEKKNALLAMGITANHEINQPLMIIQGNLDVMKNKINIKDHQKYLEKIQNSIYRIEKILNKIRDLDNIEMINYVDGLEMINLNGKNDV